MTKYKDNMYNILRRHRWTNTVFELINKVTKLLCGFMFKRCKISSTGIYTTIYVKCSDCKCNLIGEIINVPEGNTDVRMQRNVL